MPIRDGAAEDMRPALASTGCKVDVAAAGGDHEHLPEADDRQESRDGSGLGEAASEAASAHYAHGDPEDQRAHDDGQRPVSP